MARDDALFANLDRAMGELREAGAALLAEIALQRGDTGPQGDERSHLRLLSVDDGLHETGRVVEPDPLLADGPSPETTDVGHGPVQTGEFIRHDSSPRLGSDPARLGGAGARSAAGSRPRHQPDVSDAIAAVEQLRDERRQQDEADRLTQDVRRMRGSRWGAR